MAEGAAKEALADRLSLWDWRQWVFSLYADIRASKPEAAWRNWRETRDALWRNHPQTPLEGRRRETFGGLAYYAYDPALRFEVDLAPVADGAPFTLEVGRDGTMGLRPFATTVGLSSPLGKELTLYWIEGYGGGVFLPFRDETCGRETYAGGRYLLDTIKGADLGRTADGQCILDFNFAYYPSCSYSDAWACPLAPPENTLPRAVRGGERD